jgi:uncharacterized membrane protein YecN with MAPEG domain
VSAIYVAGVLLVTAQMLGIYGLMTRKADLIFALIMGVILLFAVVIGAYGVYHRIH